MLILTTSSPLYRGLNLNVNSNEHGDTLLFSSPQLFKFLLISLFKKFRFHFVWEFMRITEQRRMVYTVMQSDGNSFSGDVVSNNCNKTSRDEDNILDQIYKSKYVWIFIMMILILYNIIRKCILTQQWH